MKYGHVRLGQVEAVWNQLGGEEGVAGLLERRRKLVSTEESLFQIDRDQEVSALYIDAAYGSSIVWEDKRSLSLNLFDAADLLLEHLFFEREERVLVSTRHERMVASSPVCIPLHAELLYRLLYEKNQRILNWLSLAHNVTCMVFGGTVFSNGRDNGKFCLAANKQLDQWSATWSCHHQFTNQYWPLVLLPCSKVKARVYA